MPTAGQEPEFVGEYLAAVTRKEGAHVSLHRLPEVNKNLELRQLHARMVLVAAERCC